MCKNIKSILNYFALPKDSIEGLIFFIQVFVAEIVDLKFLLMSAKIAASQKIPPKVKSADFSKIESRYLPWFINQKLASANFFLGQASYCLLPGLRHKYHPHWLF